MTFEKLKENIRKAENDMEAALSDKWPLNSRVGVYLNCRQITPTDARHKANSITQRNIAKRFVIWKR